MTPTVQQTAASGSFANRSDQLLLGGVGLAFASLAAGLGSLTTSEVSREATLGSQTFAEVALQLDATAIIRELGSLHDRLLSRTTELDPDAKAVLYSNLWDLYSE